jgi:hypothetical protein
VGRTYLPSSKGGFVKLVGRQGGREGGRDVVGMKERGRELGKPL